MYSSGYKRVDSKDDSTDSVPREIRQPSSRKPKHREEISPFSTPEVHNTATRATKSRPSAPERDPETSSRVERGEQESNRGDIELHTPAARMDGERCAVDSAGVFDARHPHGRHQSEGQSKFFIWIYFSRMSYFQ